MHDFRTLEFLKKFVCMYQYFFAKLEDERESVANYRYINHVKSQSPLRIRQRNPLNIKLVRAGARKSFAELTSRLEYCDDA